MPAPTTQKQRARQSRVKKQKLKEVVSEGLAEHSQQLATLRSEETKSP